MVLTRKCVDSVFWWMHILYLYVNCFHCAQGYYCLAEAHRDSIDMYPLHLAFQPVREAVIHFSVAFKLSHDKQAFLECLVLSVPGG